MQTPAPPQGDTQCRICHSAISAGTPICPVCGTRRSEAAPEELRSVLYLLAELARWEADGAIKAEQAAALRAQYEERRRILQGLLSSRRDAVAGTRTEPRRHEAVLAGAGGQEVRPQALQGGPRSAATPPPLRRERRTLFEALADPYTLRILLYTGASMLVVGIVIWLRDVLYLKLQEPAVQATLLALGTVALTGAGWYIILRTRQRLTGRALTLAGSLLVPVNFWFLVRSGLIASHGRAWIIGAVCTLLYSFTAGLLRERLYVYLSCAASVATLWALVYRWEHEAFGLYALALMGASLVFLHLSRVFPESSRAGETRGQPDAETTERARVRAANQPGPWSAGLWSAPLARSALCGAMLSALFYMPLRLGSSTSLYDGVFHLRTRGYDPSLALLLFAAGAYLAWFAGRYVYANHRVALETASALALFWTEFLALDGLRLSDATALLALATTTVATAALAALVHAEDLAKALHRATLCLSVALLPVAAGVLLAAPALTARHSAALAALGISFAILSTPRFSHRVAQAILAYAAGLLTSAAFLVALASAPLESETLFAIACSSWPFVLSAGAWIALREPRGQHLAGPLLRIANLEAIALLWWASSVALLLHLSSGPTGSIAGGAGGSRAPVFCLLAGSIVYGLLLGARDRSRFGIGLASIGGLVLVAASEDALKHGGMLPQGWPIAAGVICAAFLISIASPRRPSDRGKPEGQTAPGAVINMATDTAVMICGLLWLSSALLHISEGGFAAAGVFLLGCLYWSYGAAHEQHSQPVYLACTYAGAFLVAALIGLRVEVRWFPAVFVIVLFPTFLALERWARARQSEWIARPVGMATAAVAAVAFIWAILEAVPDLRVGNPLLLQPCVAAGAVSLYSLSASMLSAGPGRLWYFRAGIYTALAAFALGCLRAGYDPVGDLEVYTSPVAVLLLLTAYLSLRREWDEFASDTTLLLWVGSILLCAPLLLRALEYRLLMDVPAPWRDVGVLFASLALVLLGVVGRLRAPVIAGGLTLASELAAIALTSVDWLQVPLKYYLITVGSLIVLVFGLIEYRREQFLLIRQRLNERRAYAREQFGAWK